MNKTKNWLILFAVLIVSSAGAYIFLQNYISGGTIVEIRLEGELYDTFDLSKVTEAYDIVIDTKLGTATVHVDIGSVSVCQADCPDHLCMKQGTIEEAGIPIVCLPNQLVVEIIGDYG